MVETVLQILGAIYLIAFLVAFRKEIGGVILGLLALLALIGFFISPVVIFFWLLDSIASR